jgi:hypothetical protein
MECHKGQFEIVLPSPTLGWSTPLGLPRQCGRCMHQHLTSGISRRRRRRRRRRTTTTTRWCSTCWRNGCGLTSSAVWINDKFCDIRERNVTIRNEIWTMYIYSLGFWDIGECVTLWGVDITEFNVYQCCTSKGWFTPWTMKSSQGPVKFVIGCWPYPGTTFIHTKEKMLEWSWSSKSPKNIFEGQHYPLTWANGFWGGIGKRGVRVEKGKGPW